MWKIILQVPADQIGLGETVIDQASRVNPTNLIGYSLLVLVLIGVIIFLYRNNMKLQAMVMESLKVNERLLIRAEDAAGLMDDLVHFKEVVNRIDRSVDVGNEKTHQTIGNILEKLTILIERLK